MVFHQEGTDSDQAVADGHSLVGFFGSISLAMIFALEGIPHVGRCLPEERYVCPLRFVYYKCSRSNVF